MGEVPAGGEVFRQALLVTDGGFSQVAAMKEARSNQDLDII